MIGGKQKSLLLIGHYQRKFILLFWKEWSYWVFLLDVFNMMQINYGENLNWKSFKTID